MLVGPCPFGICFPGTELLLTPVRTELSVGSLSRSYRRFLRVIADSYASSPIPAAFWRSAMPFVARVTKHRKTSWNTCKTLWYILKRRKTSRTTSKTLWNTLKTLWNITKHSNTRHSMRRYRLSMRRHRRSLGVFSDIGDCGVGITLQMCNRDTNHGDTSTFSKQGRTCCPTTNCWYFTVYAQRIPLVDKDVSAF